MPDHASRRSFLANPVIVRCLCFVAALCVSRPAASAEGQAPANSVFRAGAAAVDVTPTHFPVIVNGNFNEVEATRAHDRLMSRAVVLDDGRFRLAIVVVDSLMVPRELLDSAKEMAHKATGIPTERMLISATHSHSAPSAMACLGSRADPDYQQFLTRQIAKSIQQAVDNLAAAKVGWTVVHDAEHNHCRRWIYRPDRIATDPFGVHNVRAHMHPGHQSPDHIAPSGPADPDLSLLSIQSAEGRPIAVLANYAMHYYGTSPVSADFCGRFGDRLADLIGIEAGAPTFVGIMSQGTSGDSMWMDYSEPAPRRDLEKYTLEVAGVAHEAYQAIEYGRWVSLAMAETTIKLRRRTADPQRLEWAQSVLAEMGDRLPQSRQEIYAREQIYLHDEPEVEIKLQAIRIGELGITAIPNEVYGITGLKLKAQSPLQPTFNIELANGAEGYIPPPEQHALGGYTTWPARTAGLEVQAEPKIVATLLELLEKVADKPRRSPVAPASGYNTAVLDSRPVAYWRMNEMSGSQAIDTIGNHHGVYENGVAFYLPGFDTGSAISHRAAHFAGGCMQAAARDLGETYSVELWFWNGLPHDARPVTGYFFSRGTPGSKEAAGDHLGIGGTSMESANAGKLIFFNGNAKNELQVGVTVIQPKTWNHVVLVRDGPRVAAYLNGNKTPEFRGEATISRSTNADDLFVGGRNDGFASFEGKLSNVAIYDRILSQDEITTHLKMSGVEIPETLSKISSETGAANAANLNSPQPDDPPLSPADSLAATLVRPGYEIELVAAEPLVKDPVAIAWGTDGRLWVAEMGDYPLGMDGQGKPGGRIRFLEDTSGNGTYDRSTVFLDGVRFPTGVMPWRDGVLITAAPEILYAEDTNGDGRADKREVLYSGFQEGNQQLRVNGLSWGLDNWIYCASGAHHGGYGADRQLRAVKTNKTLTLGSRDFRFRPDSGELDPQSGPSQYGRNRDDWGNWFGQQNSHPLWHFALQDQYLRRNPHFAPPDPRKQLVGPNNPPVYPAKSPQKRFHSFEQSGRFTSACSAMVYRDELLFPRETTTQHAFTCEPFHNLVQHNVIVEDGVSFTSHRDPAETDTDFFASKDRWCRPVMARTGPDGALWIVDMYRYMIEHPEWLTPEGRKELEPFYREGADRGRIYRVFPTGQKARQIKNLAALDTPELVTALDSPNGPQRDLAGQLLQWRGDKSAAPLLEQMAQQSSNPLGRLHALGTLDGLGMLSPRLVQQALGDEHAGVRRHAILLAEPLAEQQDDLLLAALKLVDDPDAKVRLQLACTLGQWPGRDSAGALAELSSTVAADPYLAAAVTSSINQHNLGDVLTIALAEREDPESGQLVGQLLALSVAFDNRSATLDGLEAILRIDQDADVAWQFETVAGLLDAMERHGTSLAALVREEDDRGQEVLRQVAAFTDLARTTSLNAEASSSLRAAAVRLLARHPDQRAEDLRQLQRLLTPQTPPAIQLAIVRHLGSQSDPAIGEILLAGWRSHAPALRSETLSVLASRSAWLTALLDSIENGQVARADIDATTRQSLLAHRDKAIRARITTLLADASSTDRRKVLLEHQAVLKLAGSPLRGQPVFNKHCANCHKLDGVGHDIGPNLRSLTDSKPSSLLSSILDPSAAVDGKFVTYIVLADDGRTFTGMIASETANSITLVEKENKQHVILRTQIEDIRSTGKSLMPDGLENDITHQDFADLIAYIRAQDSKQQPPLNGSK
ncbi:PVC-type heme-binding CxxCH protein [Aureliella helgolandensis]|uniref:Cytochrome c n=1 Tax=Aureliella helgolandensis TaxID=2527968 RepID=A0A518GA81_9BACT|nr:PVC-type heme-binding CxxCH protein [Aureliella helgolandensis]QDV25494.1 Cytochrome c [Aureliella helgolandensis]